MATANCPSGDSPKHSNGHASALDLLRRFNRLQVERVEGYGQFEEAFNAFLAGSPEHETEEQTFDAYKLRVAEITIVFRRISEEIIHIKNSLRDTHNKAELSSIIEKVQDLEEAKLKATADVQIARIEASNQPDNNEGDSQAVSNLKKLLDQLAQDISETLEDLKFESEDLYAQEIDEDTLR